MTSWFPRWLLAALVVMVGTCAGQTVRIHHVNVGQGSATLIVGPQGQACLVDGGPPGQGFAAVVPLLQSEGAVLQSIVLTHYHEDHWGGIPEVIAAGHVPQAVYDRGTSNQPGSISSYLAAVSGLRTTITPGAVISLGGGLTLTCVAVNGQVFGGSTVPLGGTSQQENSRSIALRLNFGNYQEAIAGDLTGGGGGTANVEGPAAPVMGNVDCMVANHHGSSTSTNPVWMATLAPEISVCSCGANNSFGHPHIETVTTIMSAPSTVAFYRLNQGSSHVGGTTVNGTLLIETNGQTYTVSGGVVPPTTFTVDEGNQPPPVSLGYLPGDLVVSEYMQNPSVVSDADGEWVEIFNTTGITINLLGFTVRDQGTDSFTLSSLNLPARGYLTLCANGNSAQNGGVTSGFQWPSGSFFLGNGADEVEIVSPLGMVLDSVSYDDGVTFPDPNGKSVERRDLTGLPSATNFAESTTTYGLGDFGTPGGPNSVDVTGPFTGLTLSGLPESGNTLTLTLNGGFPVQARPFIMAASICRIPGILLPARERVIDLCFDDVLIFSTSPGNGAFVGFQGSLNFFGVGTCSVVIPPIPLTGLTLHLGGVVLDAGAPDGVLSIVDNLSFTIN